MPLCKVYMYIVKPRIVLKKKKSSLCRLNRDNARFRRACNCSESRHPQLFHVSLSFENHFFFFFNWSFPGGSVGKESACNAGVTGSIPGSGRSPGEGNGNLLQDSCLENSLDRGSGQATVHGVTWTVVTMGSLKKKKKRNSHLNFLKEWDTNFHKTVSWLKNWIGKSFFQCLVLLECGCLQEGLDISSHFGSL